MDFSKEDVYKMCVPAISSWKDIAPSQLTIQRLPGASNTILFISISDQTLAKTISPSKMLLRIYPQNGNHLVDRNKEHKVFAHLSATNRGIKTYHQTDKYRIEEAIEGYKLSNFELCNKFIMKTIAGILCEHHNDQGLQGVLEEFELKTPFAERFLSTWLPTFRAELANYKDMVKSKHNKEALDKLAFLATPQFESEYKELLENLKEDTVVPCHGDVHEMNMLQLKRDKTKIVLIDYEYSTFNYRSTDIAMLLNETMIDYTHPDWPTYKVYEENKWDIESLDYFVKEYLRKDAEFKAVWDVESYIGGEKECLIRCVKLAEPLVSAVWAVWSVLSVDWKNLDEEKEWKIVYALSRFEMYEKTKQSVIILHQISSIFRQYVYTQKWYYIAKNYTPYLFQY
eukprot:TRINITY_DN71162_c0_g1_i1.p1 TRINITY_DN71162_c0_g1~~TRINITY_DN71162_c0_g1_i1.p1  ORF type:complete len:398 (+),score=42.58 TRINITY_DN71162_c0_g1_i1:1138-2331(+)